jgi:hypothetical protein
MGAFGGKKILGPLFALPPEAFDGVVIVGI